MFVAVMLVGAMPMMSFAASEETYGYFKYEIVDGEVSITDCDDTAMGKIEIPSSIDGYTVTKIAPSAFSSCENITELYIPESINLISNTSFEGCLGVEKIVVDSKNTVYDSREDCNAIIETKTNTLIRGCQTTVIPDSVISIGHFAFKNITGLKSINISNGITYIGKSAFYGCSSLEGIRIPDSVTSIGDGAFYACSKLSYANIGDGVKYIGYTDFAYCTELKSLTIGSSVEKIEDLAFKGCSSLKRINIPDSVTSIGNETFALCSKLTDVIFGHGINNIGWGTFNDTDLKYAFYNGSEDSWNQVKMYDNTKETISKAKMHYNANDHAWGEWEILQPATCTSDGKRERTCSICDKTEGETIPGDHKWGEYNITEEPTKEADGKGERVCSVCGAKDEIGFKFKEDNSTGVQLMFPYESEDETIKVKDETKTIGNIIKDIKIRKIYNITMLKNGEPIQPKGSVQVRIPIPRDFNRNKVCVYHIVNNDTMECKELDFDLGGNDIEGYYVVFTTDHFSYFAIGEEVGKVNSVSVSDITLNYKALTTIKPTIEAEANAEYTVKYSSSNTKVATVDKNGNVYAEKKGSATITCTVTDSLGNVVTDTCKVTVKYSFGQWLIKIFLFGWIWY